MEICNPKFFNKLLFFRWIISSSLLFPQDDITREKRVDRLRNKFDRIKGWNVDSQRTVFYEFVLGRLRKLRIEWGILYFTSNSRIFPNMRSKIFKDYQRFLKKFFKITSNCPKVPKKKMFFMLLSEAF